ncbi:MAG: serine hydrolase [Alphaproteobacteria bacterium]|jgi:CubicO group peptidase (beta-lactamase class C family)
MATRIAGLVLMILGLSLPVFAQGITSSPDPEGAGFSAARLTRIAPWYQSQIDAGALSGAVVAVARDGRLAYLQAIGTYDRAGKIPLKPDAIFWIASMTKPVTSVAAMILVDEGKLDLSAPVAKYLPELKDLKVGLERALAKRPMEVIDLLRHTSGLTYPEEGTDALHGAYENVLTFQRDRTLADFITGLAVVPLVHQPGEVWEYSWGVDVLARVVEVVSGQPFDEFLQRRIFKPLGMVDTGFYVPEEKLARLIDPPKGGRYPTWDVTKPARLFSGGGGLVSTAPDYLRFCQMLLNGGELDGARILAANTVRQLTTDALPPGVRFTGVTGQFVGPQVGTSWGLGFAIRTNPVFSLLPGAVGSFNWSGFWGTYFWIDPSEKLIGLQLIQVAPEDNFGQYRDAFRHLVYAALRVPQPASSATPQAPVAVSGELLAGYVGTYDFGASLSAKDRQAPFPAFTYSGVGLVVAMADGRAEIRNPVDGGPAARAGVLAGDVLTEVDGSTVQGLNIEQVLAKLRGTAGSEVRLRVTRQGQANPIDVKIVREPIRRRGAQIEVRVANGALAIAATGPWSVLDFEKGKPVGVTAVSPTEFVVGDGDRTRLAFVRDASGKVSGVVLNPGPLEIKAEKIN